MAISDDEEDIETDGDVGGVGQAVVISDDKDISMDGDVEQAVVISDDEDDDRE